MRKLLNIAFAGLLATVPLAGKAETTRPEARPDNLLVDVDQDGFATLTCGWADQPCPSNDSFDGVNVFALDANDNDPAIGSFCADWPGDPYCEG